MKRTPMIATAAVTMVLMASALIPTTAMAQNTAHRQKSKNTWRNIGYGSGALAALGLIKHNNTLAIAGAAGALYSYTRYEHDRKSQSSMNRARASAYSKPYVYSNGQRYVRQVVYKNHKKYYQLVRA